MGAPDHEVVVLKNLKYYLWICHIQSLSKEAGPRGERIKCNANLEVLNIFGFAAPKPLQLEIHDKAMTFSGFSSR